MNGPGRRVDAINNRLNNYLSHRSMELLKEEIPLVQKLCSVLSSELFYQGGDDNPNAAINKSQNNNN